MEDIKSEIGNPSSISPGNVYTFLSKNYFEINMQIHMLNFQPVLKCTHMYVGLSTQNRMNELASKLFIKCVHQIN